MRADKLRLLEKMQRFLPAGSPEEKEAVGRTIARDVDEVFAGLRSTVAATAPEYDWGPFLRRVDGIERGNRFMSVKWLRETQFAGEPSFQEAISVAIASGMLTTYHSENPKNPSYPTLCCKLARQHPVVATTLSPT